MSLLRVDTIQAHSGNTVSLLNHLSSTSLDVTNKATFKSAVDILNGKLKTTDLSATSVTSDASNIINLSAASVTADTIVGQQIVTEKSIAPNIESTEILSVPTISYGSPGGSSVSQKDSKIMIDGSFSVLVSGWEYTPQNGTDWNGSTKNWNEVLSAYSDPETGAPFKLRLDVNGVTNQYWGEAQTPPGFHGLYLHKVNPVPGQGGYPEPAEDVKWVFVSWADDEMVGSNGIFIYSTDDIVDPTKVTNWLVHPDYVGYFDISSFEVKWARDAAPDRNFPGMSVIREDNIFSDKLTASSLILDDYATISKYGGLSMTSTNPEITLAHSSSTKETHIDENGLLIESNSASIRIVDEVENDSMMSLTPSGLRLYKGEPSVDLLGDKAYYITHNALTYNIEEKNMIAAGGGITIDSTLNVDENTGAISFTTPIIELGGPDYLLEEIIVSGAVYEPKNDIAPIPRFLPQGRISNPNLSAAWPSLNDTYYFSEEDSDETELVWYNARDISPASANGPINKITRVVGPDSYDLASVVLSADSLEDEGEDFVVWANIFGYDVLDSYSVTHAAYDRGERLQHVTALSATVHYDVPVYSRKAVHKDVYSPICENYLHEAFDSYDPHSRSARSMGSGYMYIAFSSPLSSAGDAGTVLHHDKLVIKSDQHMGSRVHSQITKDSINLNLLGYDEGPLSLSANWNGTDTSLKLRHPTNGDAYDTTITTGSQITIQTNGYIQSKKAIIAGEDGADNSGIGLYSYGYVAAEGPTRMLGDVIVDDGTEHTGITQDVTISGGTTLHFVKGILVDVT